MNNNRNHKRYQQCLEEMYDLRRFGIVLGLDVISGMLSNLGNPHHAFTCMHIAGTNGKGSIASALANILYHAGWTVGLYTSPHLVRFNERIRINNEEISDEGVVAAYEAVRSAHHGHREATFFEYTTAMALHAFKQAQVDWAVIETGMGGRLDATNIVTPEIAVISNINMEHREYLGHTIKAIAGEKAGIIKPGRPVITGARQKRALAEIRRTAEMHAAPFYRLGEHFRVRRRPAAGDFTYFGVNHVWPGMKTRLTGSYQVDNAAIVLAACELLMEAGALDPDAVQKGLQSHQWPGRLEMIPTEPPILIDGAHNLMAARHLAAFLREQMANREITLVIGILDDKPSPAMLQSLVPLCHRVIFTRPQIERSLPADTLYESARPLLRRGEIIENVADALSHAYDTTGPGGLVCVAGSLYVVGEAKQALAALKLTK